MEEVSSFLQNVSWCYCQIPCLSQCGSAILLCFPKPPFGVLSTGSVHLRQTAYVVFLTESRNQNE